jgi:hypothetical protein
MLSLIMAEVISTFTGFYFVQLTNLVTECLAEDNEGGQGTLDDKCDNIDALKFDDGITESHDFNRDNGTPYYAGVLVKSYDETVACNSIDSVFLCYEWWSSPASNECYIKVDSEGGASYNDVPGVDCPVKTADPGVTCVNITDLEGWNCDNFFGDDGLRARAYMEAAPSGDDISGTVTWDALYFNVTYDVNTACGTVSGDRIFSNNVSASSTCFTIDKDNVIIDCKGSSINFQTNYDFGYGITLSGVNNVVIKNCEIIQDKSDLDDGGIGVYIMGVENLTFVNNTIITRSSDSVGLYIEGGTRCNFSDNKIITLNKNSQGLISNLGRNNIFHNNSVYSAQSDSYVFYGDAESMCINDFDTTNLAEGLPVVYNYSISDETISESNIGGLICCNCNNVNYNNVTLNDDGLQIVFSSNINITNSNINTDNGMGLSLYATNNTLVDNNYINTTKDICVGINATRATSTTISNNNIRTTGDGSFGVYLATTSSDSRIINNELSTNNHEGHGVWAENTDNIKINNNSITVYDESISLLLQYSINSEISNNIIRALGSDASYGLLLLAEVNNTLLLNNEVNATTLVIYDATGNDYINKIVYNNSFGEIRWINEADDGVLKNIIFLDYIGFGTNLYIEDNLIAFNSSNFPNLIAEPTNITMYGLNMGSVDRIYKSEEFTNIKEDIIANNTNCLDDSCSLINYDSITGTLIFNSTSMSSFTAVDLTAPGTISDLSIITRGQDSLYWTWTNPSDTDYTTAIIYINDINIANTTNNYYTAGALDSNAIYTIKVHTKDSSGNINTSDVTSTTTTLPSTPGSPGAPSAPSTTAPVTGTVMPYIKPIATSFSINKAFKPKSITPNQSERINISLIVKNNDTNGEINSLTIIDELPLGFNEPNINEVKLWFNNKTNRMIINNGYEITLSNLDSDPKIELKIVINNLSSTNINDSLKSDYSIIIEYPINNIRGNITSSRTTITNVNMTDNYSNSLEQSINTSLLVKEVNFEIKRRVVNDIVNIDSFIELITIKIKGESVNNVSFIYNVPPNSKINDYTVIYCNNSSNKCREMVEWFDYVLEVRQAMNNKSLVFGLTNPHDKYFYDGDNITILTNLSINRIGSWNYPFTVHSYSATNNDYLEYEELVDYHAPLISILNYELKSYVYFMDNNPILKLIVTIIAVISSMQLTFRYVGFSNVRINKRRKK